MANPNFPTLSIGLDLVNDPTNDDVSYSFTTALRPESWNTERGRQFELDAEQPGQGSLQVPDSAGTLDPASAGSSLFTSGGASYRHCRLTATWPLTGGTTYNLFTGYAERLPITYQGNDALPHVNVQLVDRLAVFSRMILDDVLSNYIKAYGAVGYWPLNDGAGSTTAGNKINPQAPLVPINSKYGQATLNFGNDSTLDSDVGTNLVISGQHGVVRSGTPSLESGTVLAAHVGTFGNAMQGSIFLTFSATEDYHAAGRDAMLFYATSSTDAVPPFCLFISGSGTAVNQLGVGDYFGTQGVTLSSNGNVCDGKVHSVALAWSQSGSTISIQGYVDGVYYSFTATSSSYAGGVSGDWGYVRAGAHYLPSLNAVNMTFNGKLGTLAVFPTKLSQQNLSALDMSSMRGGKGYGDGTFQRYARGLKALGYSDSYISALESSSSPNLDPSSSSRMSAAVGWRGRNLLDVLTEIVTTEGGRQYVDGKGHPVFLSRNTVFKNKTSVVTFGPNGIPYEPGVTVELDPTRVYNDVVISRSGGSTVEVQDATSIRQIGQQTLSQTVYSISDSEVSDRANYLLSQYKQPSQRVSTLTFKPTNNPANWTQLLALDLGQLATVQIPTPQGLKTLSVVIERIAHSVSNGEWTISIDTSPAPTPAFILDSSVLNGTDILVY